MHDKRYQLGNIPFCLQLLLSSDKYQCFMLFMATLLISALSGRRGRFAHDYSISAPLKKLYGEKIRDITHNSMIQK